MKQELIEAGSESIHGAVLRVLLARGLRRDGECGQEREAGGGHRCI